MTVVNMTELPKVRKNYWHEGVRCIGYWPPLKSYVFFDRGHYFCISGGFLKSVYADYTGKSDE